MAMVLGGRVPGARRSLAYVYDLGNPHRVGKKMRHDEAECLMKALFFQ